jgi:DNA-binding PadR family transcriptional regulator
MPNSPAHELVRGNIDLMVLSVLADGPKYGYLIGQRLDEASGGLVQVKAGTLYPLLHRLEDEKLVRGKVDHSTGRERKWYELTAAGRRRLQLQARQWQRLADCMQTLLAGVVEPQVEGAT